MNVHQVCQNVTLEFDSHLTPSELNPVIALYLERTTLSQRRSWIQCWILKRKNSITDITLSYISVPQCCFKLLRLICFTFMLYGYCDTLSCSPNLNCLLPSLQLLDSYFASFLQINTKSITFNSCFTFLHLLIEPKCHLR